MGQHLPPNLRAGGVAWFRKADWQALLEIFEDAAVFDSFEQMGGAGDGR
jgi:hypothetical protein